MLPSLAYVRGITSDLSITSLVLACLTLFRQLLCRPDPAPRERFWLCVALALSATVLYPTALGWGNWDFYRLGWGSFALLGGFAATASVTFYARLRMVPLLLAAAVLAWTLDLLESGNLWDYLMDPWLVLLAIWQLLLAGITGLRQRLANN